MSEISIKNITPQGFDLKPESLPIVTSDYNVKVKATMADGQVLETTKKVTLEVLPVESVVISGDATIQDYGNHEYTLNFLRSDERTPNVGVKSFSVSSNVSADVLAVTKTANGFILNVPSGIESSQNVTMSVEVVLEDDSIVIGEYAVRLNCVKATSVSINGETAVKKDKPITKSYTFAYNSSATILPSVAPNVTCNNSNVTISNVTTEGFDAKFVITEDNNYTANITAQFDGFSASVSIAVEYGRDPNPHGVGEIYCSDGSYITPDINWETGDCNSIDLQGKTPIGIVVVPGSHTPDGTARIISLLECDLEQPGVGVTENKSIKFGDYTTNISQLRDYGNIGFINVYDGKTSGNYGYAATKWKINSNFNGPYYNNYYYTGGSSNFSNRGLFWSIINQDGSQNKVSYPGGMADFDGYGNTQKILEMATAEDWRNATSLTDSLNRGYYPAACICARYKTVGTSEGDWYLPSCAELIYELYYFKLIQSIFEKLSTSVNVCLLNRGYISSTEIDKTYCFGVSLYSCECNNTYKSSGLPVRPFLAI